MTSVTITIVDVGGTADVGPMTVAEAVVKVKADRARYRSTMFWLSFSDCESCRGEGFDEGRRCAECSERDDELTTESLPPRLMRRLGFVRFRIPEENGQRVVPADGYDCRRDREDSLWCEVHLDDFAGNSSACVAVAATVRAATRFG